MKCELRSARRYYDAVREILPSEWDPIGVRGRPEAHNEYDSYVHKLSLMIVRREPRDRLADRLWKFETSAMGMSGDRQRAERVADRLIGLRNRSQSGG